ncbi:hypothetical protein OSH11_13780 [Kaistia dalseonensis]|uniref:Galactitol-specific phosphotransferase system IIC component n=1 Tax=Kaistia dalseonensis TaxID=410840 RepID=A0ABU0H7U6_9HYPH|nr:hypothetical protein [Kaistia dalseonensis]MCX5495779.1 hypothetical protein [Kaistia dalseonensis]MDQ0438379.1 galactitol-specific phosphotransferase system IIC component [Kaistia dalseonensis]
MTRLRPVLLGAAAIAIPMALLGAPILVIADVISPQAGYLALGAVLALSTLVALLVAPEADEP